MNEVEHQKAAILDAAIDAVVSVDLNGRILEFNGAAERMFGWSESEALGRHAGELLVPPDDLPMRNERFRHLAALAEGDATPAPVELALLHKDGTPLAVEATAARTTINGVPALVAFFHDVSAERQAIAAMRSQERSFRELVESLPLAVYRESIGDSFATTYASPQVEEIAGYPVERWTEDPYFYDSLIEPDDRPRVLHALAAARDQGVPFHEEFRLRTADGSTVWVEDHARVILDESGPALQGYILDITARKEAEASLRTSQQETIARLSRAAEAHDVDTGFHIERMGAYCGLLARLAGLEHDRVELIRQASPLHDVGKIGVPDSILLKPGPLTGDEWRIMNEHMRIGHRILAGSSSPLLELAATIALTHHEHVDGSGKPQGLAGDAIPIEGRIAAVADVFDALSSDRPYRRALPPTDVVAELRRSAGSHLDPRLVMLFLGSLDQVAEVRANVEGARSIA